MEKAYLIDMCGVGDERTRSDVLMRGHHAFTAETPRSAHECSQLPPLTTEFRRDGVPCASLVFTPNYKHAILSIARGETRIPFSTARSGDSGVSYKSRTGICHRHKTTLRRTRALSFSSAISCDSIGVGRQRFPGLGCIYTSNL